MYIQYPYLVDYAAMLESLDDACAAIQKAIGQDDGGLAGLFFSYETLESWPDMTSAERCASMAEYLAFERLHSNLTADQFDKIIHARKES